MVLHLELSVKRVHMAALVFLIFAGVSGVTAMPRAFAVSGTGWLAPSFHGCRLALVLRRGEFPTFDLVPDRGYEFGHRGSVRTFSAPQGRDRRGRLRLVAGADLAARQVVRAQPQRGSTSEAAAVAVRESIWVTSQPMEEPDDRRYLFGTIEWTGWDRILFASDYPHWDFDDPSFRPVRHASALSKPLRATRVPYTG